MIDAAAKNSRGIYSSFENLFLVVLVLVDVFVVLYGQTPFVCKCAGYPPQ